MQTPWDTICPVCADVPGLRRCPPIQNDNGRENDSAEVQPESNEAVQAQIQEDEALAKALAASVDEQNNNNNGEAQPETDGALQAQTQSDEALARALVVIDAEQNNNNNVEAEAPKQDN